jgi:hypothetical protein
MKRSDFVKGFGVGTMGLMLPKNQFFSNKPIKIYDNYLRGLKYYDFNKVSGSLKEGQELQLVRDSENKHDRFATEVHWQSHKLGYIAAYENIVIANMLDAGAQLNTFVSEVERSGEPYFYEVGIAVYAQLVKPTEKLIQTALSEHRADNVNDRYRGF